MEITLSKRHAENADSNGFRRRCVEKHSNITKTWISWVVDTHAARFLLLFTLFWIVAAASFSGYVGKWGLRDGSERFGIEKMLDGTAHKPFVYRQLVPGIANSVDLVFSEEYKDKLVRGINPGKVFVQVVANADTKLRFRYLVVYYLSFTALFVTLFVLQKIVLDAGGNKQASILAPTAFVLAFPYIQTNGGYFYDTVELLFLGLTFLAVSRKNLLLFFVLVIPATLNKETFFFFIPALYPFIRAYFTATRSITIIGAAILVSGIINVLIKSMYADAPGVAGEMHLLRNMELYSTFRNFRAIELTYGIIGPSKMAIPTVLIVFLIMLSGWSACPLKIRQHLCLAAAINFPLFFVLASAGELRNLSLLFIGFVILTAYAIDRKKATESDSVSSGARQLDKSAMTKASSS